MFIPFVFNMSTFNEAPYLWWFYKGLDFVKRTDSAIVAQEIYCDTPVSTFASNGRLEASDKQFIDEHWMYRLPKRKDMQTARIYKIPNALLEPLIREKGSVSDAFCYLLKQPDADLCAFLDRLIVRIESERGEKIEGFITLMALPSLTKVACDRGIPVIHFELGCLREPTYLKTAFWDLQDLQGGDSVGRRWERFQREHEQRPIPMFSKRECLALLLEKEKLPLLDGYDRRPVKQIGVALGYTTYEIFSYKTHLNDSELLYRVRQKYGMEQMLIRRHPGDPYGGQYPRYAPAMDKPKRSMPDFILDCETVISLLSGTGVEAMLWGRKAITLLPSPSYFASGHEIEGEGKCADEGFISFFAFCYLIPLEFLTDLDYLRWRLTMPTEREIYFKHLDLYFKKKTIPTDLIFGTPGSRLDRMLSAQNFQLKGDGAS